MTKAKSTKRALLMSVLSMLLCCTMLIGTTFAWFTDSVTTGTNRIVAGNLDVELYYRNAFTANDWEDAKAVPEKAPTFFVDKDGNDILWEPGVMAITEFKVENAGTLALKYELVTKISDKNTVTVGDDEHDLSEVISFSVVKGEFDKEKYATRDSILADEDIEFKGFAAFEAKNDLLEPEKDDIFTVIAYWKPNDNDIDNIYNINNGKIVSDVKEAIDPENHLWIDIDINLLATQTPHEEDSFGEKYDSEAEYPVDKSSIIGSAERENALIEAGYTAAASAKDVEDAEIGKVVLTGDITDKMTLTSDKEIDSNGHNINNAVSVKNGANSTLRTGSVKSVNVQEGGTLTLDNCNLTGSMSVSAGSELIIKGGKCTTSIDTDYTESEAPKKITIEDGDFSGNGLMMFFTGSNSVININGGKFSGNSSYWNVFGTGSNVTISGGTFENLGLTGPGIDSKFTIEDGIFINFGTFTLRKGSVITVNGGTFTGKLGFSIQNSSEASSITVTINGGTFDSEIPASYLGEGKTCVDNGDGTYTVR